MTKHQVKIKKASIVDLNGLAPLFDGYRVFYGKESDLVLAREFLTERLERNESTIFIATINDHFVGFTQLYPLFSSVSAQRLVLLNDLYVFPDHRNKKIATLLIEAAQQHAKDAKAKGLILETAKDNPAQKLYERLGWELDTDFLHYSYTL